MKDDDLLGRLKKGTSRVKGPWKKVGPKQPPKRRNKSNVKTRTNSDDTESAVQREIVLSARRLGIRLFRQQAGRIYTGQYTIQLAPKGAADLTGLLSNGIRLEVECKQRYAGTQSSAQKDWQKFIEENNGVYILAHSGDEFKDKITPILKEML